MRQTASFFSPPPASPTGPVSGRPDGEVVGWGRGWGAFGPRMTDNNNRKPATPTVRAALRWSTLPTARKSSRGEGA
jgi:hypothetical protein